MARSNNSSWPKPLLTLIEASHSREAMQQFRDYVPDDRAWDIFKEMSQGMLTVVRPEGSSCVIMSALLATALEEPLGTVVPVVAGALKLDGEYMYGSNRAVDGRRVFSENGADWMAPAGFYSATVSSTSRWDGPPAKAIAAPRWRAACCPPSASTSA